MTTRLVFLTTGGTIASRPTRDGVAPRLSGADVTAGVREELKRLGIRTDIVVEEVFQRPSYALTHDEQLSLIRHVRDAAARGDVDGIVVTHGSDTLTDSAWLTHLSVGSSAVPVAFTCAMRHAEEAGADGFRNVIDAARTVLHPRAAGHGVLVVVNGEIHGAPWVVKSRTTALSTFISPMIGQVGDLHTGEVRFTRPVAIPGLEPLPAPAKLAPVGLIPAWAGAGDAVAAALCAHGVQGLVFEGTGAGHVHPSACRSLEQALADGLPVVVVSRADGPVHRHYGGGPGSGRWLDERPVLDGGSLGAPRALSALAVGLGSGVDLKSWWPSVVSHQQGLTG